MGQIVVLPGETLEQRLLAEIQVQQDVLSESLHALTRRQRILREAATALRLGRSAQYVRAVIEEQDRTLAQEIG